MAGDVRTYAVLPLVLLIEYGRYVLIAPVLLVWGVLILIGADFTGGVVGHVAGALLFGLAWLASVSAPGVTLTAEGGFEGIDETAFVVRVVLTGGLVLWLVSLTWHAVRRTKPRQRTLRERLRRIPLVALGVSGLFFLLMMVTPSYTTMGLGVGAFAVVSILLFIAILLTGWWVALVGIAADALSGRLSGRSGADEEELRSPGLGTQSG